MITENNRMKFSGRGVGAAKTNQTGKQQNVNEGTHNSSVQALIVMK